MMPSVSPGGGAGACIPSPPKTEPQPCDAWGDAWGDAAGRGENLRRRQERPARDAIFALPSFCLLLAAATAYFQVRFWRAAPALFAAMLVGLAGISWFDGRLALYPWNNADQIAAIEAGLAGTKPEAVTALVPRGYGRGGPGRFALALDPAMQMAVLDPQRDLPLLQASGPDRGLLAGARAVFLAEDETGALSEELNRIAAGLRMAGYPDRGEGVWRTP